MFDINKYLGKWYELAHYPSWFQRNDNYNTTANYTLTNDGIKVVNTTISNGKVIQSIGKAKVLEDFTLRVDFDMPEVAKLQKSGEFDVKNVITDANYPNYVIDHIFLKGNTYAYAVVTDADKKSFYLLSRCSNPPLHEYNEVMQYVIQHYDRDLLVQTPHFE